MREEWLSITAVKGFSCYFAVWCGVCGSTSSKPKEISVFLASNRTTYVFGRTFAGLRLQMMGLPAVEVQAERDQAEAQSTMAYAFHTGRMDVPWAQRTHRQKGMCVALASPLYELKP